MSRHGVDAPFSAWGIRIERDQERGGEHVRRSHRADVRRVVPPDAYVLPADAMLPVPLPHVHALVERVRGVAPERGIPLRGMRERVRTVLLRAVLEAVVQFTHVGRMGEAPVRAAERHGVARRARAGIDARDAMLRIVLTR